MIKKESIAQLKIYLRKVINAQQCAAPDVTVATAPIAWVSAGLVLNMDKRVFKAKRVKADESLLSNKFEAALLEMIAAFKKTDAFKHAQTKGNERELPVRSILKDNLPSCYDAVGGEIIDIRNNSSGQIDVIVYNHHRNSAFLSGGSSVLAAEAPLITIEVKSLLSRQEVAKSLKGAKKLKELKPLGKELCQVREDGAPFDGAFRYFHCIFSYNTDLKADGWGVNEYRRFNEVASELQIDPNVIDRIYVVNKGMLIPEKAILLPEEEHNGYGLLQFILHAISFCAREDERRPRVDYINYASSASKRWESLM